MCKQFEMKICQLTKLQKTSDPQKGKLFDLLWSFLNKINDFWKKMSMKMFSTIADKSYQTQSVHEKSPEIQREIFLKKKKTNPLPTEKDVTDLPFITWGGSCVVNGKSVQMGNTSPVDNSLMILYSLYTKNSAFRSFFNSIKCDKMEILKGIFLHLDNYEICMAKYKWIADIMKKPFMTQYDLWGTERDHFYIFLSKLTLFKRSDVCTNSDCAQYSHSRTFNESSLGIGDIFCVSPENFLSEFTKPKNGLYCPVCSRTGNRLIDYVNGYPPLIVIPIIPRSDKKVMKHEDISKTYKLKHVMYSTYAYTV